MCKLKSCIVLQDRVFCPDYDSHDKMLSELKIKDTRKNAESLFVRVELSPEDDDVFSPVDGWKMTVDQDIRPEWFLEEVDRPRVVAAVKEWSEKHVFCDKKDLMLNGGIYYLKNSTATLRGNSTATLSDNSTATLSDNSTATLWDNSTATLYGNSVGIIPDSMLAGKRNNYTARDNATIKDCKHKVICQSGGWKFEVVTHEQD